LNTPWLIVGSARQGTGSLPQFAGLVGTADVLPIDTPMSSTSKLSPFWKASVTVNVNPSLGATNVHGGAPTKWEFPLLLGTHPNPPGSAGAQPFAKLPALVKLNSFHGPPTAIGPVGAILATLGAWGLSLVPFSCAKAGTDKKLIDAKAITAVDFMIILLVTAHEVIMTTWRADNISAVMLVYVSYLTFYVQH
jgi:hypothetical protein